MLAMPLFYAPRAFPEPVALLAPARPHPENSAQTAGPAPQIWETDALISLMYPYKYENTDLDMPQSLAVLEPAQKPDAGGIKLERRDLLGDIEEIRYLDKKAWGINLALSRPGANHLTLETKPWWDEENKLYRQYQVKSPILTGDVDTGWDIPLGLELEILPLTRPFGLSAPCLFSAAVYQDSKPVPGILVRAGHINEERLAAPTPWHESLTVRTNANGEFSVIFNRPGWWYCEASQEREPLKSPEGEFSPLLFATVFWVYIDPMPADKKIKASRQKN